MGNILDELDNLGPELADKNKVHRRFIELSVKLESLPKAQRCCGICAQATYRDLINRDNLGKLDAHIERKLTLYTERLANKVAKIEAGEDPRSIRLREREAKTPSMKMEAARDALLAHMLDDVKALSARCLLGNVEPTDEERLTVDLIRSMIARWPHLNAKLNA